MDEQVAAAALVTERKRFEALSEVMELTEELSEAIQRQDQVSIRMFLGMRQEPINQLREYQNMRRQIQRKLSEEDGRVLRALLSSEAEGTTPMTKSLRKAVDQNRHLLDRVLKLDRQLSIKIGGDKSFYAETDQGKHL